MSPAAQPDLYERLGVSPTSSQAEIKSAYRALAQQLHPDHNPGSTDQAAARFRAVTEAYEVLRDRGRRAHYDEQRAAAARPASANAAPHPEPVWVFCSVCGQPTVCYPDAPALCSICVSTYAPAPGPEPYYAETLTPPSGQAKNAGGGSVVIVLAFLIYLLTHHAS